MSTSERIPEFTSARLKALAARGTVTVTSEGSPGLILRLGPRRSTWSARIAWRGLDLRIIIGPYPRIGIAQALDILEDLRQRAEVGLDPRSSRKLVRVATLAECIDLWLSEAAGQKHRERRARRLRLALPGLLNKPAGMFSTDDLRDALALIVKEHPTTARLAITDLNSVFNVAKAQKLVADNPAALLRRPPRRLDQSYPDLSDLASILGQVDELPRSEALFLRFLALSGCRTGEALQIAPQHIDLAGRRIVLPPAITKTGIEHWIPLSPPLARVVEAARGMVRGRATPLFGEVSKRRRARLVEWVNERCRVKAERDSAAWKRLHAFRKTFQTEGQRIGLDGEHIDAAIGHRTKGSVRAAYDFFDSWPQRQRVCEAWCHALDLLQNPSAQMTQKSGLERWLRTEVQAFVAQWEIDDHDAIAAQ